MSRSHTRIGPIALTGALFGVALAACAPAVPEVSGATVGTTTAPQAGTGVTTTALVVPPTLPPSTTSTTLIVSEALRVVHAIRDRSSSAPPYTAIVEFPVVEGEVADPGAFSTANALIESHVDEISEPAIELLDAVGAPRDSDPPSVYLLIYEIAFASESLLSIRFFEENFITGTDLPTRGVSTLLVELASGVALELDDLVVGGEAKPAVTQLAIDLVRERYYEGVEDDFAFYADRIASEGVRHVLLTADGLEVWFDELEAGPAELGTPTVTIPYDALEGVLDPLGAARDVLDQ